MDVMFEIALALTRWTVYAEVGIYKRKILRRKKEENKRTIMKKSKTTRSRPRKK